ncbi:MAG: hypothetical protein HRU51_01140, partial [Xanthomonadales bacterium]|nr:hypothetical protein [Xanthomonadales bacterium]
MHRPEAYLLQLQVSPARTRFFSAAGEKRLDGCTFMHRTGPGVKIMGLRARRKLGSQNTSYFIVFIIFLKTIRRQQRFDRRQSKARNALGPIFPQTYPQHLPQWCQKPVTGSQGRTAYAPLKAPTVYNSAVIKSNRRACFVKKHIEELLSQALLHLQRDEVIPADTDVQPQLERTRSVEHGDYASNL